MTIDSEKRLKQRMTVAEKRLKQHAAVERWKANNREYYLKQKRELSARPQYRAKMLAKYNREQAEKKDAGILLRKMGRPRMYDGEEAIEMKKQRAREASARYRRRRELFHVEENNESTTSSSSSEKSD